MYIDKLIKKEVITLLVLVSLLVIIFIGVTYAKFLSVDKGQDTVINMGDLNISFCKDTTCDSTYTNIGQVIGTKVENGTTIPADIYPFKNDGSYSNETPYIFKVTNTGSLDSTVKIKLKEDTSFTPSGDYSSYARLTSKYAGHLKVAIRKRVLYQDTGYQLGDVNMDGIVNNEDSSLLLKYIAGNIDFNETQIILGDTTDDGIIDSRDKFNIDRMLIGGKTTLETMYIYSYTDLEDGVIFKNDIIKAGESATYFLWLYLDETTPNDAQNTFFVGNIDVDGEFIPISFSNDSWSTIIANVKAGNGSVYKVGDIKEIDMGTYGTHTLRVANTSTPSECSETSFSQTACGFVLEFADIITTHKMNDTTTNVGGWPVTSMRTFVNNDIYNAIPSEIKNAIIDTTVVSGHGYNDTTNFTSTDKLYLLAPGEVWTDWKTSRRASTDTAKDLTRTLDYYTSIGVTTSNYSGAIKKYGTNDYFWWLRAAYSYNTDTFLDANNIGDWSYDAANGTSGVAPAFRLG